VRAVKKLRLLLQTAATTGRAHQEFIGAAWLLWLLWLTPARWKRGVALWIISLSPHYFYRAFRPEYKTMPLRPFLEAECERNRATREIICRQLVVPHLPPSSRVLDIGCGPGFLAAAVARHAAAVWACDISRGVLACAQVINGAENIQYIHSSDSGFAPIPDETLDFVYSIAVIQHLRESVITYLLSIASRKLRPGGTCCLQVQLDDGQWKGEAEWASNRSLTGRLKLKYALNFFPRSEAFFRDAAEAAGLSLTSIVPVSAFLTDSCDDIYGQHLLLLIKPNGDQSAKPKA